jgi:hypothetical protein
MLKDAKGRFGGKGGAAELEDRLLKAGVEGMRVLETEVRGHRAGETGGALAWATDSHPLCATRPNSNLFREFSLRKQG